MRRFVEGTDGQSALFPECLEDWIGEDNPVRVIDVFAAELDLAELRVQRSRWPSRPGAHRSGPAEALRVPVRQPGVGGPAGSSVRPDATLRSCG